MPINNFKLFDEKKANMMSDDDYAINQQRLNGVQSGVASSQLQNKTLYQTALMCYALAQLMAANGYDANDANAVSTFVNNLSRSMVQKVVDKASANDIAGKIAGKWVDAKQLGDLKTDVEDNYLPLLGGTMIGDLFLNRDPASSLQAATKNYVDMKDLKLYSGQYTGNGTYGSSNPTSITFPFAPSIFFLPNQQHFPRVNLSYGMLAISTFSLSTNYIDVQIPGSSKTIYMKKSSDGKTITWYSESVDDQMNYSGLIYFYSAIGGYDMGGATEFIITESGNFIVPRTGRYMLELYGGGGGTSNYGLLDEGDAIQGGSSCQRYDSISLTVGDSIAVTIGVGGSSAYGDASHAAGTATSFGTYSVNGGGAADGRTATGGSGSGNLGTAGRVIKYSDTNRFNNNNGTFGSLYGVGGWGGRSTSASGGKLGKNGAVYLKYLGA